MFGFINENESVLVVHSDVWWKYCFILSNKKQVEMFISVREWEPRILNEILQFA